MALYTIRFEEQGGYRVQCRIRAAAVADHVALAVQKIWGAGAVWVPMSATEGRVYVAVGEEDVDLVPKTGLTQVEQRRGR